MKTIIVVTFFGILSYAYTTTHSCSEEPAMHDFQPEMFFRDRWYLGHGSQLTPPAVCQTFHTNDPKRDTLFVEFGYNKYQSRGIGGNLTCDGGKKSTGNYSFKCQRDECGLENYDYVVDLTILFTDYCDYAVICKSTTFDDGEKEDMFHIFKRTLHNDSYEKFC